MADFRKLVVWQRAHALNLRVSVVAGKMRGASFLSLRSQMVRAAHSIPTNIVEGRGQKSDAQFTRFLMISLNSTSELEYHLITARDLHALRAQDVERLIQDVSEIRRMLHGFIRTVDKSKRP